jgi:hypothetical protein
MGISAGATTDLFAGVNKVIDARLGVKDFRTRTAALELTAKKPLAFDGQDLVQVLFERLDTNWTSMLQGVSRPPSLQNFRWNKPRPSISSHNASPEVTLERALINACVHANRIDWSNQVPLISGIAGPRAYKRRAIDLVHRDENGGFEFVELKVCNRTPVYAAIEILLYGLLWLLSRRDRHLLGYASNPILDASILQLSVLAPADFYIAFRRDDFPTALSTGLSILGKRFGVQMSFKQMVFAKSFRWPATPDRELLYWLDRREVI